MIAKELVVSLVLMMCPNLEEYSNKYTIQGEQTNCMDYYVNDIINNPSKYKKELAYVKSKRK